MNTDWMREAKWGVFIHYLASVSNQSRTRKGAENLSSDDWNRRVDAFDVNSLAEQLASVNAGYCLLTLGQNSGHFCSPNEVYDDLTGIRPSKCARRDIVSELADNLNARGIRMMVYLPSHAPVYDTTALKKLKCTPRWKASRWQLKDEYADCDPGGTDERLSEFQQNWESVIRCWSNRWKKKISGWWFDGCYYADIMYRNSDPPNFNSFAAAAKSGNAESIVAFNMGVKNPVISVTEHEDYTAGEIAWDLPTYNPELWPADKQYHICTFLGTLWGRGKPRFSEEFVAGYSKHIIDHDGVISWDVKVGYDGIIDPDHLGQLKAIGKLL